MAVREIEFRKRKLAAVFARAKLFDGSGDPLERQADYARHLCVLLSGFVERSVADIVLAYAQDKTAAPLRSFLEASLRRLTNVDKDRLLRVVGSLDAAWRGELERFVVDERQAALNSIVGLRNDIAHGGGASISLRQVERYWVVLQEVIDKLEEILMPARKPKGAR